MTEDQYRAKQLRAQWVGVAVSFLTLLAVGLAAFAAYRNYQQQVAQLNEQVRQFNTRLEQDQNAQLEQRRKEYELRFYDRQAEVYFELCDVAGRLAASDPPVDADIRRFDQLLVGKLGIVGDSAVVDAAARLNLRLHGRAGSRPQRPLSELVWELTEVCRNSLLVAFPGVQRSIGRLPAPGALGPIAPEPPKDK